MMCYLDINRSLVDTLCQKDGTSVSELCQGVITSSEHMLSNDLKDNITMGNFGAEKILEREINQAAHSDIVEKLVAEL